jgi:cold shock protein
MTSIQLPTVFEERAVFESKPPPGELDRARSDKSLSESVGTPALEKAGDSKMPEGTIKRKVDRGFGFIRTEGGNDLFFHMSAVSATTFEDLREGQRVTYTEGVGQKGPCAENVKPV